MKIRFKAVFFKSFGKALYNAADNVQSVYFLVKVGNASAENFKGSGLLAVVENYGNIL